MQKTFLLTYRSIITPMELLDLLKLRYSMPLPDGNEASLKVFQATHQKPIQLRVCQLLKSWVQRHFTDFENDEALQQAFMDFATNTIKPTYPVGSTLETLMTRQINGEFAKTKESVFSNPPPKTISPKSSNNVSFIDFNPLEVARQLTIIESNIFRNIAPNECIGLAWSKKDAKERSPNILQMINRFNKVSDWVVTAIVTADNPKQRTEILSKFIEVAARCKSLNNFNGAMEIISGLGNSAIHRLKPNWADVNKKVLASYTELTEILSSDQSYKSFRAFLKTVDGACIPYLGMYLTDLTFIEDGNPDKIGDLHNFSKRTFVSNIIQEIQQYQQTPYHLEECSIISNYLEKISEKNLSGDEAYKISLQILPRGGAKPTATPSSSSTTTTTTSASSSNQSPSTPSKSTSSVVNNKDIVENNQETPQKVDPANIELEDIPGYLFNQPDSDKNIKIKEKSSDSIEPPIVLAGTLEKLVERVTFREYPDPRFLDIFLLTYRSFSTGVQLLELLIMRFNMPKPKNSDLLENFQKLIQLPVQLRVLNVLKTWTDKYPEDFLIEKNLRENFFNFCIENTSIHQAKLKRMMKTLKRSLVNLRSGNNDSNHHHHNNQSKLQITDTIPKPFPINSNADLKHLKIYDFHPEEIARQLCIVDFQLFFDLQQRELFNYYKKDENQNRSCPMLIKMIRNAQILEDWVLYEVFSKLTLDDEHDSEVCYEKLLLFLKIAFSCYTLGNFHAFYAIFQACTSSEVKDNDSLWHLVMERSRDKVTQLEKYFDDIQTYDSFVQKTGKRFSSAGIPPVQTFLNELEIIENEEDDFINNNLINMHKYTSKAVIISQFCSYKNIPYAFERIEWLQNYIQNDIPRLASFRSGISFVDQFETLGLF